MGARSATCISTGGAALSARSIAFRNSSGTGTVFRSTHTMIWAKYSTRGCRPAVGPARYAPLGSTLKYTRRRLAPITGATPGIVSQLMLRWFLPGSRSLAGTVTAT